jgi:ABC-type dipeptide/oligopeptide/nickel transport system permease subunit
VSASASSRASSLQASNAFASAGAAAPDEFYDEYTMDLEAEGYWARARRRFFRHRLAVVSLFILGGLLVAAVFAGQLARYGYNEPNIDALSSGPSWAHPFGTDQTGRDYFSRTVLGLRTEIELALVVGLVGTLIGTLLGVASGYFGGFTDHVVMRLVDLMLTIPPLVLVLMTASFLHTDTFFEVTLLIAAVLWMPVARIVRATALGLREQEYVQAARAVGASDSRILRKHILPNAVGAVAVAASVMAASAVIIETTLSYLGFGVNSLYGGRQDVVRPSVGEVLQGAQVEGLFNWWGIVFPGIAIVLIVAPIFFIGDGIRDALDPTQRRYVSARELARRRRGPGRLTRLVRAIPWPHVSVRFRTPERVLAMLDALPRRRVAKRRLWVEAVAVVVLTAAAAAAVYAWKVNPVHSEWAFAGSALQNVSRAPGAQTQLAVATDPTRAGSLLAVSNDTSLRTIRVYTSQDAGRTWTSRPGPALGIDACARGEPSVAADARGRQYVAFSVSATCTAYDPAPYVAVAVRASATAPWVVHRMAPKRPADFWDDYPSLASGGGRVYVVWSRLLRWTYETTVVSSTTDGRKWTAPQVIDRRLSYPRLATATVAQDGTVYVTGIDARFGVWLARSRDAGRTFALRRVAQLPSNRAADCSTASSHPTPFQGIRCVGPNPSVAAAPKRVFVTYGIGWAGEPQTVAVRAFDSLLRPAGQATVGPSPERSDRFWPASAYDAARGRLWVCFYDTSGDPSREQAWYSCTHSDGGRTWSEPVRAAREPANAEVLWEDARVYSFGDVIGFGGYTAVAAAGGKAHPLWIDTRDLGGRKQEVFGATLR